MNIICQLTLFSLSSEVAAILNGYANRIETKFEFRPSLCITETQNTEQRDGDGDSDKRAECLLLVELCKPGHDRGGRYYYGRHSPHYRMTGAMDIQARPSERATGLYHVTQDSALSIVTGKTTTAIRAMHTV